MDNKTIGVSLIFIGVLFSLDRIFIDSSPLFTTWWPLLLCFLGIVHMRNRGKAGSVILFTIGLIFLLRNLGFLPTKVFAFWPLLLVAIGLYIVLNKPTDTYRGQHQRKSHSSASPNDHNNSFRHVAIFHGINHTARARTLQHGELIAVFGGITLDLHNIQLNEKGGTLNVFVLAGGIELRIPKEWQVETSPTVLFGGVDDKRPRSSNKDGKVLTIKGTVLMGGIQIDS